MTKAITALVLAVLGAQAADLRVYVAGESIEEYNHFNTLPFNSDGSLVTTSNTPGEYGWMLPFAERLRLRDASLDVVWVGSGCWGDQNLYGCSTGTYTGNVPTSAISGTTIAAWQAYNGDELTEREFCYDAAFASRGGNDFGAELPRAEFESQLRDLVLDLDAGSNCREHPLIFVTAHMPDVNGYDYDDSQSGIDAWMDAQRSYFYQSAQNVVTTLNGDGRHVFLIDMWTPFYEQWPTTAFPAPSWWTEVDGVGKLDMETMMIDGFHPRRLASIYAGEIVADQIDVTAVRQYLTGESVSSMASAASSSSPASSASSAISSSVSSAAAVSSAQSSAASVSSVSVLASYLSGQTFPVDGTFGPYDFTDGYAQGDEKFDWAYATLSGQVFQMMGSEPSEHNVFGWKATDVAMPEPQWYMFALGNDVDGDGSQRFDWILVASFMQAVYKLKGVSDDGTFKYSAPVALGYTIEEGEIRFESLDIVTPTVQYITFGDYDGNVYRIEATPDATPENLSDRLDALGSVWPDERINVSPNGAWYLINTERFEDPCHGWACLALVDADFTTAEVLQTGAGVLHSAANFAVGNGGDLVIFNQDDTDDLFVTRRTNGLWSTPVAITSASPYAYHSMPAIRSDDTRVLFNCGASFYGYNETNICEVGVDGTGFQVIAEYGGELYNLMHPDYDVDGGYVFEADDMTYKVDAPGGTPYPYAVTGSDQDNSPCVLPDGNVAIVDYTDRHGLKVWTPSGHFALTLETDIGDVIGCGGQ